MFHLSVRWMMWGERDVWYHSLKKFQVLRCASQHQATTRQWPYPTEKPFQFPTIIIIILPNLSFTSNKTQLFHWTRTQKSVCVRSRTKPKVSIAATQWAHEQNAFVISFSVFSFFFIIYINNRREPNRQTKKKWKLFLISTCELFFTFFYVVSFSPTHKLSRSSLRLIFVNETRKKLEK